MLLDHATDSRTQKADAADLLRMDDDGGMGSETGGGHPTAPARGVGGANWAYRGERFPASASLARKHGSEVPISIRILSDWPMSPATIAERRREGGGAPSQRRRASAESGWRRFRVHGHGDDDGEADVRALMARRSWRVNGWDAEIGPTELLGY